MWQHFFKEKMENLLKNLKKTIAKSNFSTNEQYFLFFGHLATFFLKPAK